MIYENAEAYYRRAFAAINRPIDPASTTPALNKAIWLTGLIVDRMKAWEEYELAEYKEGKGVNVVSLRAVFNEKDNFFDDSTPCEEHRKRMASGKKVSWQDEQSSNPNWYLLTLKIEAELRGMFHNRNESVLQKHDANYLIECLRLILPTYRTEYDMMFNKQVWNGKQLVRVPNRLFSEDEIGGIEYDNVSFTANICQALHSWGEKIADYIKIYSTDLFKEHREEIEFYLNGGKITPTSTDQKPEPTEPTGPGAKGPLKNLPPKILLLHELGFFDLPKVKVLDWEAKGKLISALCGGNADNATDYIRACDPDKLARNDNPYRNPKNIQAAKELLALLNKG